MGSAEGRGSSKTVVAEVFRLTRVEASRQIGPRGREAERNAAISREGRPGGLTHANTAQKGRANGE
jgi:hypothetical protein